MADLWVLGMGFPDHRDVREYVVIGPFSDPVKAEESLTYMAARPGIAKATVKRTADVPLKYRPMLSDLAVECAEDREPLPEVDDRQGSLLEAV